MTRTEWQPIETAPKDQARVMLFSAWPMKRIVVARWIGSPHECWLCEGGGLADRVTHWMPLPDPPALEQDRKAA
jgi:hypothetical protein